MCLFPSLKEKVGISFKDSPFNFILWFPYYLHLNRLCVLCFNSYWWVFYSYFSIVGLFSHHTILSHSWLADIFIWLSKPIHKYSISVSFPGVQGYKVIDANGRLQTSTIACSLFSACICFTLDSGNGTFKIVSPETQLPPFLRWLGMSLLLLTLSTWLAWVSSCTALGSIEERPERKGHSVCTNCILECHVLTLLSSAGHRARTRVCKITKSVDFLPVLRPNIQGQGGEGHFDRQGQPTRRRRRGLHHHQHTELPQTGVLTFQPLASSQSLSLGGFLESLVCVPFTWTPALNKPLRSLLTLS